MRRATSRRGSRRVLEAGDRQALDDRALNRPGEPTLAGQGVAATARAGRGRRASAGAGHPDAFPGREDRGGADSDATPTAPGSPGGAEFAPPDAIPPTTSTDDMKGDAAMKNIAGLMKQAAQMQQKMARDAGQARGDGGGGRRRRRHGASHDERQRRDEGRKIDPKLADPEDTEMLEDLIVAAHADAKRKIDAMVA